jgi:hypothetical protein
LLLVAVRKKNAKAAIKTLPGQTLMHHIVTQRKASVKKRPGMIVNVAIECFARHLIVFFSGSDCNGITSFFVRQYRWKAYKASS